MKKQRKDRNRPNIFSHWNKDVRLDTDKFRGGLFQQLYKSEKDYLFHQKSNNLYNVRNYFKQEIRNEPAYIELFTKLLENSIKYATPSKTGKLNATKVINEATKFLKNSKIPQFEKLVNEPLFKQFKDEVRQIFNPQSNLNKYTNITKIKDIKEDSQIPWNNKLLSKEDTQFTKTLLQLSNKSIRDNVHLKFTSGSTLLFSTQNLFHDETYTRLTPTIRENIQDILKLVKDNKIKNMDFVTIDVNIDRDEFLKRLSKFETANKEFGDPWFSLNAVFNKGYHTEEYSIPELGLRMSVSNPDSEQVTSYVEQFSFNESQFNENFPTLQSFFKLEMFYYREEGLRRGRQTFNNILEWIERELEMRKVGGVYEKVAKTFKKPYNSDVPKPQDKNFNLYYETRNIPKTELLEYIEEIGGSNAFRDKFLEELQRFKGFKDRYPFIDKLNDKRRNGQLLNLSTRGEQFFKIWEKTTNIHNEMIID